MHRWSLTICLLLSLQLQRPASLRPNAAPPCLTPPYAWPTSTRHPLDREAAASSPDKPLPVSHSEMHAAAAGDGACFRLHRHGRCFESGDWRAAALSVCVNMQLRLHRHILFVQVACFSHAPCMPVSTTAAGTGVSKRNRCQCCSSSSGCDVTPRAAGGARARAREAAAAHGRRCSGGVVECESAS